MHTDIEATANKLACDPRISDYDFWRSLRNINNEIFVISSSKRPIPIEMLRWRVILRQARSKRGVA